MLPLQLLAQVLQHVPLQHRAASCALVCISWRAAAALATTAVAVGRNDSLAGNASEEDCTSLSAWLQCHPDKACISSIAVEADYKGKPQLQLPLAQLQGLQDLELSRALWSTVEPQQVEPYFAAALAHPDVGPALPTLAVLTALTRLSLHHTSVKLAGLQQVTQLKSLTCGAQVGRGALDTPAEQVAAAIFHLAAALPVLQHLTSLALHEDLACDQVLAHVTCLARLQRLEVVDDAHCSVNSFAALPTSLTALRVHGGRNTEADDLHQYLKLTPSSTPGIYQLTKLQDLCLENVMVDTALLEPLTALTALSMGEAGVISAPGVSQWLVFSKLTCLQALDLFRYPETALPMSMQASLNACS